MGVGAVQKEVKVFLLLSVHAVKMTTTDSTCINMRMTADVVLKGHRAAGVRNRSEVCITRS
jgi:hypothetical protein